MKKGPDLPALCLPAHAPEDRVVDMLDGKVEIRTDLILVGDEIEKPIGEVVRLWIGVKDPNPSEPFDPD